MTSATSCPDGSLPGGISRRVFLRLLATAAGATAYCGLASCSFPEVRSWPFSTPSASLRPPVPTATPPQPTATAEPSATPPQPTATAEPTATPSLPPHSFIVDGHMDLAWIWLEFGRHPAESALESREREAGTAVARIIGTRTTGLPELLEGRVGIIIASIFVMPERRAYSRWRSQIYASASEANQKGLEQLDAYKQLALSVPEFTLITTRQDLDEVVAAWRNPAPPQPPKVGLVVSMEGADPILKPAQVAEWHDLGLRIVGPAWTSTRYSGGTWEPGPLTDSGRELLHAMSNLGMILDVSHMSSEAMLEALDTYAGEIIASHRNPQAFSPTDRGFPDATVLRLASRGGVIGIMPCNLYLRPGWRWGDPRTEVPVRTVAEAIDHFVQLTGTVEHVALGSDFDGGFGLECLPSGMESVADLGLIADALLAMGYQEDDVDAIMSGNWLRVLRASLPSRGQAVDVLGYLPADKRREILLRVQSDIDDDLWF